MSFNIVMVGAYQNYRNCLSWVTKAHSYNFQPVGSNRELINEDQVNKGRVADIGYKNNLNPAKCYYSFNNPKIQFRPLLPQKKGMLNKVRADSP